MKITNIKRMRLIGPREHTVGGGKSTTSKLIVKIESDCGQYGLGEVSDIIGVEDALDYVTATLRNRNPFDIDPLFKEVIEGSLPPHSQTQMENSKEFDIAKIKVMSGSPTGSQTGPLIWALSGINQALYDLIGKVLKVPVYNLLGGAFRKAVRVYLDRSTPENKEDLGEWKKFAEESAEYGFDFLKFDIDFMAPELTTDVWNRLITTKQLNRIYTCLDTVRQSVGPDMELSVDLHQRYNMPAALRIMHKVASLDLAWLEDPILPNNVEGYRTLCEKSNIPICMGEGLVPEELRVYIDAKACDIIHPDILYVGGISAMKQISQYADLHSIPVAMHGNAGSLGAIAAAHAAANIPNFMGIEYHWIESDWVGKIVKREGMDLFKNGCINLTDAPGLGVELNKDVCEKYYHDGQKIW